MTYYVDGVAIDTEAISDLSGLNLDNTSELRFLNNAAGNTSMDEGYVANYIAITKDVLTPAELQTIVLNPSYVLELDNLAACLEVPAQGSFFDRSPNAATVTLTGTLDYLGYSEVETTITDTDDAVPTSGAVVDYAQPVSQNAIIVRTAADLSGALSSGVVYIVDGEIDMGTQAITVPSGGLEIGGYGLNVSKLYSTENSYTMFVDAASDAGNLFLSNITIDVSGTTSQVFDLDNSGANGAVEVNVTNFENCTSLGTLDAYRQFLLFNSFWNNCDDGLTFAGTWAGGASIRTFLVRNFGATGTVFTGSTSPALTFGSRFICDGNIDVPSGATVYGFSESNFDNDGDFELIAGEYTGAGEVVDPAQIDQTSVKSRFRDNNFSGGSGVDNTYIGSRWKVTTETTTPATVGTQVKLLGTTTYSDEEWFSNTTDNAFVYDSTLQSKMIIQGVVSIASGNNNQIVLLVRHWDDSASAYVDVWESPYLTTNGSGRGENKAVLAFVDMNENDRIELWARNDTDNDDMTMLENSELAIMERAN